jgi:SAM-dependent methyltransferase
VNNPWLSIPLADYEGHMALPAVAQTTMLSEHFAALLRAQAPASVAVLGCAGGNGFERIDPGVTTRVVGVDLNPVYIAAVRARFGGRFASLETICADLAAPAAANGDLTACEPVSLVCAALLFEYVELAPALATSAALVAPDGVLATVLQEPSANVAAVTPSPYASLKALLPRLRHVQPEALATAAAALGFRQSGRIRLVSAAGRGFVAQTFRRGVARGQTGGGMAGRG